MGLPVVIPVQELVKEEIQKLLCLYPVRQMTQLVLIVNLRKLPEYPVYIRGHILVEKEWGIRTKHRLHQAVSSLQVKQGHQPGDPDADNSEIDFAPGRESRLRAQRAGGDLDGGAVTFYKLNGVAFDWRKPRRDFNAVENDGNEIILLLWFHPFEMEFLVQGIMMHHKFKIRLYVYLFDITLTEGSGELQSVVDDRNFQLFREAGQEIKRRLDSKFEDHRCAANVSKSLLSL
jgi:hypothetical protein